MSNQRKPQKLMDFKKVVRLLKSEIGDFTEEKYFYFNSETRTFYSDNENSIAMELMKLATALKVTEVAIIYENTATDFKLLIAAFDNSIQGGNTFMNVMLEHFEYSVFKLINRIKLERTEANNE